MIRSSETQYTSVVGCRALLPFSLVRLFRVTTCGLLLALTTS